MNKEDLVSAKDIKEERTGYDGYTGWEKVLNNGNKIFVSDVVKDGKVYVRFYNNNTTKATKLYVSDEAALALHTLLSRSRHVDEEVFLAC